MSARGPLGRDVLDRAALGFNGIPGAQLDDSQEAHGYGGTDWNRNPLTLDSDFVSGHTESLSGAPWHSPARSSAVH